MYSMGHFVLNGKINFWIFSFPVKIVYGYFVLQVKKKEHNLPKYYLIL